MTSTTTGTTGATVPDAAAVREAADQVAFLAAFADTDGATLPAQTLRNARTAEAYLATLPAGTRDARHAAESAAFHLARYGAAALEDGLAAESDAFALLLVATSYPLPGVHGPQVRGLADVLADAAAPYLFPADGGEWWRAADQVARQVAERARLTVAGEQWRAEAVATLPADAVAEADLAAARRRVAAWQRAERVAVAFAERESAAWLTEREAARRDAAADQERWRAEVAARLAARVA